VTVAWNCEDTELGHTAVGNLKLIYKMGILVGVLVLTALGIAAAGFVGLHQVAARVDHLANVTTEDFDTCREMRVRLLGAIRAQKNAVISSDDKRSAEFAGQARSDSQEMERLRQKLVNRRGADPSMELRQALDAFSRNWADYQKTEERVLKLAVQSTTTKAQALWTGPALEKETATAAALEALGKQIDQRAGAEPAAGAKLVGAARLLGVAQAAVYRYHQTLGAHIMASGAEMDQLEGQLTQQQKEVETALAELGKLLPDEKDQGQLAKAAAAWADYGKSATEVRRLSRLNTNLEASELSLGQAFTESDEAYQKLTAVMGQLRNEFLGDVNASQQAGNAAQLQMLMITLIGIALGLTMSALVVRSITRPVGRSAAVARAMAQGDLTQRSQLAQQDEVGQLAGAMDRVGATLAGILRDLQGKAGQVGQSSDELVQVSQRLLAQSEQVATQSTNVAGATEELSHSIQSMAAAAEEMSMNVASISSASEEVSVSIGTVSSAAEQTSTNVQAVAKSVDDISASFGEIARAAQDSSRVTNKLAEMAAAASARMAALNQAAAEINKVTETIKTIALQTNLLALNATIEATSAGEAGKGFAVVAHEIKELANQSGRAAEGIAARIEGMQASTREAVQGIQEVAEVIRTINTEAGRISEAVAKQTEAAQAIARNVNEASTGVGEIARSIAEVAGGANDMAKNVAEAAQGANAVSKNAAEASRAANDIAANIHGVSTATQETSASASQVSRSAEALTRIGTGLREIVGKFKTDCKDA
jgi:methyl-accepting chemotaxis protein